MKHLLSLIAACLVIGIPAAAHSPGPRSGMDLKGVSYFNVKNYGAVADAVAASCTWTSYPVLCTDVGTGTDDSAAFHAAIDAAAASGAGTKVIYVPAGSYRAQILIDENDIHLMCDPGATIYPPLTMTDGGAIILVCSDSTCAPTDWSVDPLTRIENPTISGCTVMDDRPDRSGQQYYIGQVAGWAGTTPSNDAQAVSDYSGTVTGTMLVTDATWDANMDDEDWVELSSCTTGARDGYYRVHEAVAGASFYVYADFGASDGTDECDWDQRPGPDERAKRVDNNDHIFKVLGYEPTNSLIYFIAQDSGDEFADDTYHLEEFLTNEWETAVTAIDTDCTNYCDEPDTNATHGIYLAMTTNANIYNNVVENIGCIGIAVDAELFVDADTPAIENNETPDPNSYSARVHHNYVSNTPSIPATALAWPDATAANIARGRCVALREGWCRHCSFSDNMVSGGAYSGGASVQNAIVNGMAVISGGADFSTFQGNVLIDESKITEWTSATTSGSYLEQVGAGIILDPHYSSMVGVQILNNLVFTQSVDDHRNFGSIIVSSDDLSLGDIVIAGNALYGKIYLGLDTYVGDATSTPILLDNSITCGSISDNLPGADYAISTLALDLLIDGFSITNCTGGVWYSQTHGTAKNIDNVTIRNGWATGVGSTTANGEAIIYHDQTAGLDESMTIENVVIEADANANAANVIDCQGAPNSRVLNSRITNADNDAVFDCFEVKNTEIETTGGDGIVATSLSNPVYIGNTITSAGDDGILLSGTTDAVVAKNTIVSSGDEGIEIASSLYSRIMDNTIVTATGDAILDSGTSAFSYCDGNTSRGGTLSTFSVTDANTTGGTPLVGDVYTAEGGGAPEGVLVAVDLSGDPNLFTAIPNDVTDDDIDDNDDLDETGGAGWDLEDVTVTQDATAAPAITCTGGGSTEANNKEIPTD